MSSCIVASNVTAESVGWMIGFRVWHLKAYDSKGNCVACVDQDMGLNRVKFVAFLQAVANAGYCLTPDQIGYIQSQLLLDYPQFDNRLARFATIQVARYAANKVVDKALEGVPFGRLIAGEVLGASPADIMEQTLHALGI